MLTKILTYDIYFFIKFLDLSDKKAITIFQIFSFINFSKTFYFSSFLSYIEYKKEMILMIFMLKFRK